MTAGDAWTGLVIRLADDDLLTGHVLTSVAGWGPELEINIALSSMGQDEIGHARRLYALVIPDRADIERFVYEQAGGGLPGRPAGPHLSPGVGGAAGPAVPRRDRRRRPGRRAGP